MNIVRQPIASLSKKDQLSIIENIVDSHESSDHVTDCSIVTIFENLAETLNKLSEETAAENLTSWTKMHELKEYQQTGKYNWTQDQNEIEKKTIQLFGYRNALNFANPRCPLAKFSFSWSE